MPRRNNFTTERAIALLDEIRAMIKTRPEFTASQMGAELRRATKLMSKYLRHLAQTGEIHFVTSKGQLLIWRDGPLPPNAKPMREQKIRECNALKTKRKFVAAEQIGIPRGAWEEAFFGPARVAA